MRRKKEIAAATELGRSIDPPTGKPLADRSFWTKLHNWGCRSKELIRENLREPAGMSLRAKLDYSEAQLHVELQVSLTAPELLTMRSFALVSPSDDLGDVIDRLNTEVARMGERLIVAGRALRSPDLEELKRTPKIVGLNIPQEPYILRELVARIFDEEIADHFPRELLLRAQELTS